MTEITRENLYDLVWAEPTWKTAYSGFRIEFEETVIDADQRTGRCVPHDRCGS